MSRSFQQLLSLSPSIFTSLAYEIAETLEEAVDLSSEDSSTDKP
jgi:hypothetical protein